jgi:uncharacterized protein YyaL (SSP411 family)
VTCRFLALALFLAGALLTRGAGGEEKTATSVEWHPQVYEAWKIAQAHDRPLVVFLALGGCAYCHKMEHETWRDPRVAEQIKENFVASRVNASSDPTLVERLKVDLYPCTVIISPDNKVLDTLRGYVPADEVHRRLHLIARQRLASKASHDGSAK